MEKVRQFSRKYTAVYCIAAAALFLAVLTGIAAILGTFAGDWNFYVRMLIQEAAGGLFAYGVLCVSGLKRVLSNKGSGFLKGLLVGMYLIVISIYSAVLYLAMYAGDTALQPWYLIAAYVCCMICVGIAEEFIFRGVVATLLLQKFKTGRSGIWKAAAISGVIFGIAHLSNIAGAPPVGVFVQAVIASMLGMLLAAIYFRTGCIWVTVFLHAAIDIAAAIPTGLYGSGTMVDTISSYGPENLISCIPYLIVILVLLRKKKIGEVQEHMDALVEEKG